MKITRNDATSQETDSERALHLYRAKDYTAAYQALVQACFKTPNNPEILIGLALSLEKLGRFSQCASQWKHLQRVMPQYYQDAIKIRHANALIEIGDYETARQLLKGVEATTSDSGEKSRLIEKIALKTARGADQTAMGLPSTKSTENSNYTSHLGHAGKIVTGNAELSREYSELIVNTGTTGGLLNYESLIIVTYGRTGSTLLQGILNTIDGLVVLGENDHAFYQLFEYERKIQKLVDLQGTETPSSPYFGANRLSIEQAKKSVRDVIEGFFAPFREDGNVDCIGFKEVKFAQTSEDLIEYLEFLNDAFPKPAFIFLWRNHDDVLASGWWKNEDIVQASSVLDRVEEKSRSFSLHKTNCFEITFEDIGSDSPELRRLFEFLGAKYNHDTIDRVIQIPHSYNPENEEIRALFHGTHRPS